MAAGAGAPLAGAFADAEGASAGVDSGGGAAVPPRASEFPPGAAPFSDAARSVASAGEGGGGGGGAAGAKAAGAGCSAGAADWARVSSREAVMPTLYSGIEPSGAGSVEFDTFLGSAGAAARDSSEGAGICSAGGAGSPRFSATITCCEVAFCDSSCIATRCEWIVKPTAATKAAAAAIGASARGSRYHGHFIFRGFARTGESATAGGVVASATSSPRRATSFSESGRGSEAASAASDNWQRRHVEKCARQWVTSAGARERS